MEKIETGMKVLVEATIEYNHDLSEYAHVKVGSKVLLIHKDELIEKE